MVSISRLAQLFAKKLGSSDTHPRYSEELSVCAIDFVCPFLSPVFTKLLRKWLFFCSVDFSFYFHVKRLFLLTIINMEITLAMDWKWFVVQVYYITSAEFNRQFVYSLCLPIVLAAWNLLTYSAEYFWRFFMKTFGHHFGSERIWMFWLIRPQNNRQFLLKTSITNSNLCRNSSMRKNQS